MSWIALKMLTGDKAKFFGIVLGLTFAALLITQQGSIFCGLMLRTAGQISDITGADLWVMDPNVRFIDDVKPMIETNLYRVRGVEGVKWAVPLYKGNGRAKLRNVDAQGVHHDVIEQVILLGLDDASLVGAPQKLWCGSYRDLRRPDAVIVDRVGLRKLFPGQGGDQSTDPAFLQRFVGREMEMNDHRAIIVGICEASRTFQSNAVVYTLYSRAKLFVPQERKPLTFILAKTETGHSSEEVAKRIESQTGLGARTSEQFSWMTINYFLKYTGIPINFGITTVLGFLVGTAIAGQTFYNFTIENLKQFGSLKAMGAGNWRIVEMILLQATVVGLLGYGLGVGLASVFGQANKNTELAYFTPWQLLPLTGAAVVFICILSSILCIRRVVVLEPAVVFRG
ncbi:MAG TPA: ABC transporter permease [Isosphaeraceae bacterium]|nr:ABC transporter permease [Isosphaeraceae bacterium]